MPDLTQTQMNSYRRMLARRHTSAGLESLEAPAVASDNEASIRERTEQSREALLKLVEEYYGKDDDRKELVHRIVREGGEALRMLAGNDGRALGANPPALEGLEAIVRTDGSRPSFLIRDGEVDRASSPIGSWGDALSVSDAQLRKAIASVGRIDVPGSSVGFQGTGLLVGPDLIITNRHVLQVIGQEQPDGSWRLFPDVAVDFGHEFKARSTVNRRRLKQVLFCGSRAIVPTAIDHTKLDLALIELEPAGASGQTPFALQVSPTAWSNPSATIFTIGYPGNPPPFAYAPTLLDQLFHASFGYKRLAPGELISPQSSTAAWTLGHDATTLGGNSGSVVLVFGNEGVAAGLHYGGRPTLPAENWGHKLEKALGETNGRSSISLYEILQKHGATVHGQPDGRAEVPAAPAAPPSPTAITADWRKGVTLKMMRPLTFLSKPRLEGAELEATQDGVTPPEQFDGRNGYAADFLAGFPIPLPLSQRDMRSLRRGGNGVELKYEHFSVVLSASRRMPMMTACNINGGESRQLPRVQQWKFDGRLDREDQLGNDLYRDNDVDRGHMVRREDPIWGSLAISKRANVDTFHYTNSCPQMAGVNQVIWLGLENYVLSHTREDAMHVSVYTGPFFTDNDFPYRGALIPKSFWKIVAFLLDDGRPSATAYKVSQDRELQDLEFVFAGYKTFQISVQQVADATGLDFSALLPFDGFSQHERVHGTILTERIDQLDQIRV